MVFTSTLQAREIIEHRNHINVYRVNVKLPYLYTLDLTKILFTCHSDDFIELFYINVFM
jgi:hypothetical protein